MDFNNRSRKPNTDDEPLIDEEGDTNPRGPWPTEAEIENERRMLRLEEGQNRTNQLLMQLQLEYRQGMNQLAEKVNKLELAVTNSMGEVASLLKRFLANGG